jgi:hypothetical protein
VAVRRRPTRCTFVLALFKDGNQVMEWAVTGTAAAVPKPPGMNPASLYQLEAAAASFQNGPPDSPWSDPVPLVLTPPQAVALEYDGTAITARWQQPAAPVTIDAGSFGLWDGNQLAQTGLAAVGAQGATLTARWVPPSPIDPSIAYQVGVAAASTGPGLGAPVSVGQPAPRLDLVQARPVLRQLRFVDQPQGITIYCDPVGGGLPPVQVRLYADGEPLAPPYDGQAPRVAFAPTPPIGPGLTWSATLSVRDGPSTGPPSNGLDVLIEPPTPTLVANDGAAFTLTWTDGGLQPSPDGGQFFYTQDGVSNPGTQTSSKGRGTFTPKSPPLPNRNAIAIASTLEAGPGQSVGPFAPAIPIIVGTPTVSGANVAANLATLPFSLVSETAVRLYRVAVRVDDGPPVPIGSAGTSPALVALPPIEPKIYTAVIVAAGDRTQGPWSAPFGLIVHAPKCRNIRYTGPQLVVEFDAVIDPDASQYVCTVTAPGVSPMSVTVSGSPATFDNPGLSASVAYQVNLQAIGPDRTGPASPAEPVITATPTIREVDAGDAAAQVTFGPVDQPGVTGYEMQIMSDGVTVSGPVSVPVSPGSIPLPTTIDPSKGYALSVRAVGDRVQGPWSQDWALLLVEPAGTKLVYNGSHLVARWDAVSPPPNIPPPITYLAQLIVDGTGEAPVPAAGASQPFDDPFLSGSLYGARVRGVAGGVQGPWSAIAPGPYRQDFTYQFDGLGRLVGVAVASAGATTYATDVLGNITAVTSTPAGRRASPAAAGNREDGRRWAAAQPSPRLRT